MFQCDPYTASKEIQSLRTQLRTVMPDNPIISGWTSYSQTDEDSIIREILSRIAGKLAPSNTFIEIGCSDGLENNTHQLILDGYKGFGLMAVRKKLILLKENLKGLSFQIYILLKAMCLRKI